jgi:predicted transporter
MIGKLILTTLILLAQSANAQTTSSTRILGIGIGTLIIIIAVIFAIVWCLACRNSSRPELYSLIGLLVPVILIIAFALTPKSSQRSATTNVTDSNFIPHIVFMVLSLLGFLISGVFLLINEAFTYKKAKNVARSAFTVREE